MTYLADVVLILCCFALVFGPSLVLVWRLDRRDHRLQQEAVGTVRAASAVEIERWSEAHRAVLAHRLSQIHRNCLEEVETTDEPHRGGAMTRLRDIEEAERKLLRADRAAAA